MERGDEWRMDVMKYDVSKIAGEVIEVLTKYAVPASVRDHVFDSIRSNYNFKAVIPAKSKPSGGKAFPYGVNSARVMEVIVTTAVRGSGNKQEQPARMVTQYWSFDGKLLAENDPYLPEILSTCSDNNFTSI